MPGTEARRREIHDAAPQGTVDWALSAQVLRQAVDVVDFSLADSRKELAQINERYGEVFRTAAYVYGEAGAAYLRLITVNH